MNKKKYIIDILVVILYFTALILSIIGIFSNSPEFTITWYDIILAILILGQEIRIKRLQKEGEGNE